MDVSIVIVNYKVCDLVVECISSIIDGTNGCQYEIIFVDNASHDCSVELVREKFPQVHVIENKANKGFGAACNQGINISKGEFVLFINPDVRIIDNAVCKTVDRMRENPQVGIAGVHLLHEDMTHQDSVRRFPRLTDQILILLKVPHFFKNIATVDNYLMKGFDYSKDASVDQVMGAFMCVRKKLLDEIGFFDERFFLWFEEVDLCKRAKEADWEVRYFSGIDVVHHRGRSFKKKRLLRKQLILISSMVKYFLKYL